MPLPLAAAARAATTAGNVGATALGIGMGKTDLELTQELFKMQMRQSKRLFTADHVESSVRHGEACLQSAQQHAEAQAMSAASYYQTEKINSQTIKLARDQDARAFEIVWRAEVRESLRDELQNQNNRFNIIMLCDTVCLSCMFTLIADGSPPTETPYVMLNAYVFCMGLSTAIFTVSLWCCVIVVRRLHEHTASNLERKLFAQSEDLQRSWRKQLSMTPVPPSGPNEMHLVNQAYEEWLAKYIDPIANWAIWLMSVGVVAMFITAGLLVHSQYTIDYDSPISIAYLFWSTVIFTSLIVLVMKFSEDTKEKKKIGVYDTSWHDNSTAETGPFAKIIKAAHELFSHTAKDLASTDRMEQYRNRERKELDRCNKTTALYDRVTTLRKESIQRANARKDVLQILTTATEELDTLPEDLLSKLHKMIHDVDEADQRTADVVAESPEVNELEVSASQKDWSLHMKRIPTTSRRPMLCHPIDVQRIPVELTSLRKKLGEVPLTTLLRIKNASDEPLRLKSGVQLKEGKYIKSITVVDSTKNHVSYQLFPGTEIPARSEVVIVARSTGGRWLATSGIDGDIVYTNRDGTWSFRIRFVNELFAPVRRCQVKATYMNDKPEEEQEDDDLLSMSKPFWQISRDELDRKQNNEVAVTIDVLRGVDATKAAHSHRQSLVVLKAGVLLKNMDFGLRLQWHQRRVRLTATEFRFDYMAGNCEGKIPISEILHVRAVSNVLGKKDRVFEIHTKTTDIVNNEPMKFCAGSMTDRDDWIRLITGAMGVDDTAISTQNEDQQEIAADEGDEFPSRSLKGALSRGSSNGLGFEHGVECITTTGSLGGTEVLPPI